MYKIIFRQSLAKIYKLLTMRIAEKWLANSRRCRSCSICKLSNIQTECKFSVWPMAVGWSQRWHKKWLHNIRNHKWSEWSWMFEWPKRMVKEYGIPSTIRIKKKVLKFGLNNNLLIAPANTGRHYNNTLVITTEHTSKGTCSIQFQP